MAGSRQIVYDSAHMLRRVLLLLLAVILLGDIGAPVIASAHSDASATIALKFPTSASPAFPDSMAQPIRAHAVAVPVQTGLLVILVIASIALAPALIQGDGRARRMVLIALSGALILGGFEGALHSVHHLGDPRAADRCVVASSTDHVSAADADISIAEGTITFVLWTLVPAPAPIARTVAFAPAAGRAPPA
jgi:hypothetical protein